MKKLLPQLSERNEGRIEAVKDFIRGGCAAGPRQLFKRVLQRVKKTDVRKKFFFAEKLGNWDNFQLN